MIDRAALRKFFDESKVKRDEDGKFAPKGGSKMAAGAPRPRHVASIYARGPAYDGEKEKAPRDPATKVGPTKDMPFKMRQAYAEYAQQLRDKPPAAPKGEDRAALPAALSDADAAAGSVYRKLERRPQKPAAMSEAAYVEMGRWANNRSRELRADIEEKGRNRRLVPEGTDPKDLRLAFNHARNVALHDVGLIELKDFAFTDEAKARMTPLTRYMVYVRRRLNDVFRAERAGEWDQFRREFGKPFKKPKFYALDSRGHKAGEEHKRFYRWEQHTLVKAWGFGGAVRSGISAIRNLGRGTAPGTEGLGAGAWTTRQKAYAAALRSRRPARDALAQEAAATARSRALRGQRRGAMWEAKGAMAGQRTRGALNQARVAGTAAGSALSRAGQFISRNRWGIARGAAALGGSAALGYSAWQGWRNAQAKRRSSIFGANDMAKSDHPVHGVYVETPESRARYEARRAARMAYRQRLETDPDFKAQEEAKRAAEVAKKRAKRLAMEAEADAIAERERATLAARAKAAEEAAARRARRNGGAAPAARQESGSGRTLSQAELEQRRAAARAPRGGGAGRIKRLFGAPGSGKIAAAAAVGGLLAAGAVGAMTARRDRGREGRA